MDVFRGVDVRLRDVVDERVLDFVDRLRVVARSFTLEARLRDGAIVDLLVEDFERL